MNQRPHDPVTGSNRTDRGVDGVVGISARGTAVASQSVLPPTQIEADPPAVAIQPFSSRTYSSRGEPGHIERHPLPRIFGQSPCSCDLAHSLPGLPIGRCGRAIPPTILKRDFRHADPFTASHQVHRTSCSFRRRGVVRRPTRRRQWNFRRTLREDGFGECCCQFRYRSGWATPDAEQHKLLGPGNRPSGPDEHFELGDGAIEPQDYLSTATASLRRGHRQRQQRRPDILPNQFVIPGLCPYRRTDLADHTDLSVSATLDQLHPIWI